MVLVHGNQILTLEQNPTIITSYLSRGRNILILFNKCIALVTTKNPYTRPRLFITFTFHTAITGRCDDAREKVHQILEGR